MKFMNLDQSFSPVSPNLNHLFPVIQPERDSSIYFFYCPLRSFSPVSQQFEHFGIRTQ